MFQKKQAFVEEENIQLYHFGNKISKKLDVFYNPEMKINRDFSLLFIASYFSRPITYCDPMAASGIRQMRFLSTIPSFFKTLTTGDVSKKAINTMKTHFRINKISTKKVDFSRANAINTLSSQYFEMIEIDPFGTPVPFLDIALQRIKHKGILSITATDTAALCGIYPKTGLRRYGLRTGYTFWYEEFGLRALIAYCQREAAKYDKALKVELSFSAKHFYKIFFRVIESKQQALNDIKSQRYIHWDKQTQDIVSTSYEEEKSFGKLYMGALKNNSIVEKMIENLELLDHKKEAKLLLEKLQQEDDIVGYFNPHKLQRSHKFNCDKKFDEIMQGLKEKGFLTSRPHNNRLGIKTDAKCEDIIAVMKK